MAASTTSHRPIKGILKKKGSIDSSVLTITEPSVTPGPSTEVGAGTGSGEELSKKSQKWDEMSIVATYHPEDKKYRLMNIDKFDSPYHSTIRDTEDKSISNSEITGTIVLDLLTQRLPVAKGKEPKFLVHWSESSEEEEDLRRQFKLKRKVHYSEGLNIKFAQQLISREVLGNTEEEAPQDQEMQEEASEMESTAAEASESEMLAEDNEDYDISKL
uniref:Protein phosphatase inhibitor 2-like n=1 Tax=Phascolarctos cinereus TaxID=38626 RepID=A0A6P5JBF5_PHACI|nr:protein phosphatase inhibitor 2-like [Phascolarctos cinereus]